MSEETAPLQHARKDGVVVARRHLQTSVMDGLQLQSWVYTRDDDARGEGNRPPSLGTPLLCLPEEFGNSRTYHKFAVALLALKGLPGRIYTVDLRGRGETRDGSIKESSPVTDADDILALCDAHGFHHVDMLVSGRTALALLLVVQRRPGLLRRLILNDAAPEFDDVGFARTTTLTHRASPPKTWDNAVEILKATKGTEFTALNDSNWNVLARMIWRDQNGKPKEDYTKAIARRAKSVDFDERQPALWTEFKMLKQTQLLLIRGANSLLVTDEIASRMADTLDNMSEVIARGQGHVPILHINKIPQAVHDFLNA